MATVKDKLMLQRSDFTEYRDISKNIDDNRPNPYIIEAQRGQMARFLGLALYSAMQADYTPDIPTSEGTFTEQRFTDLWFGVVYELNGFDVKFNGLKPAAVYWAYRRLEHNQDINVTRFGTRKLADTDFSVDTTTHSHEVDAGSEALAYQSDVIDFLNTNISDYPEYFHSRFREKTGFKFTKV